MPRIAVAERNTKETQIKIELSLDGKGQHDISTGIPFFDHMLTFFSVHGLIDLKIKATGDLDVDYHHTVEDTGLLLGELFTQALGERKGIRRYGYAVTPMDDAIASVAIDLSNRPFLVFNLPETMVYAGGFDAQTTKEFFRAFANKSGMNIHINVKYGENQHHIIEAIFKSTARALRKAVERDSRFKDVRSSKGLL